jgi:O-antigen/teichoic acid export membrane protein
MDGPSFLIKIDGDAHPRRGPRGAIATPAAYETSCHGLAPPLIIPNSSMEEANRIANKRSSALRYGARASIVGPVFGQISWTAIDETLIGLANFGANLVLARWLTPLEYGGYMTASALFWIVASAHGGFLPEPMMVFGAGRFHDRLSSYFATVVALHWSVSTVIAGGLAAVGLGLTLWGSQVSGSSVFGYALAAPVVLFLGLLRRTFYVRSVPRSAAGASMIYLVGTLVIVYAVYSVGALSPFTAALTMAGASALAIGAMIATRPVRLWSPCRGQTLREVAAAHWGYGRWAVTTGILMWVPGSIYFLIVPLLAGLEANAALSALRTLVLPALHLNTAFTLLLVPAFARVRQSERAKSPVWIALVALVLAAAVYVLLIGLLGRPLMDLLYRGQYTQYAPLSWLIGLIALPAAAIAVLGSALRACERPDRVLWAYVLSTIVTCIFGIPVVAAWGLLGAILGLLAGYLTTMLVMLWWVLRPDMWAEPRVITKLTA